VTNALLLVASNQPKLRTASQISAEAYSVHSYRAVFIILRMPRANGHPPALSDRPSPSRTPISLLSVRGTLHDSTTARPRRDSTILPALMPDPRWHMQCRSSALSPKLGTTLPITPRTQHRGRSEKFDNRPRREATNRHVEIKTLQFRLSSQVLENVVRIQDESMCL
jgi:hypothetical protein